MSTTRLRVLQVGKFFAPERGGIETYLKSLCDHLAGDVDVEVVVANTAPRSRCDRVDGIPVMRTLSLGRLSSAPVLPLLPRVLAAARADVVHLHAPNPMAELAYLTSPLAARSKLVVTWHADPRGDAVLAPLYRPLARRLLARADAICVATPRHVTGSRFLRGHADACHVCTFGVAVPTRPVAADAVAAVRATAAGRPLLLGVGRLVYYKGFDVLIEAVRDLDAVLLLVGEGPERARLEALVRTAGAQERVRLLGELPDLEAHFAACDVFVLPSTHPSEAFGIVQLEAMAHGKPVVSTRLGTGVEWVNRDGESGLVVRPGDPAALRAALVRLLGDPALAARLGAAGRARVVREFTPERAAAEVLAVYRRVTAADGARRPVAAPAVVAPGGLAHVG
jgi:rhamnosyl/mannosyltransferase